MSVITCRPVGRLATCVLAFVALTGCQSTYPDSAKAGIDSIPQVGYSADIPAFRGPWADQFENAYQHTLTIKQRQILGDGIISAEEYAELRNDFVACVESFGAEVTLQPYGAFAVTQGSLTSEQVTNDVVPTCENSTVGYIGALYEQLTRNPQRQDEATIVVACLRASGLVDSAYSPAQYVSDLAANSGLDWSEPMVVSCAKDPLGMSE